jgi:UDP-GlcNAc:undecaprenyl-phosphate/decaprenyl-phosphate GlcNAc-1-phosphate transferase
VTLPFYVYPLAFASSLLVTALTLPIWRAWCGRVGLVDDPGHRKIHAEAIPLAGGLSVMTGLAIPLAAAILLLKLPILEANTINLLRHGVNRRAMELGTILLGALGMIILGWLDDKHELRPAVKFIGQFVIAGITAAAGVRITLFVHNLPFSYLISILWILTVTNAFNFMDNMNGLCAGLGAISAACFAGVAATQDQYLVALTAFLVCGALVGFLPYNFPRASAFLGDTGSHLIGYLLSVLAILPHFYSRKNPHAWAVLSPLLILAVPLGDLVWVVILRWRIGQPFYIGDNNHLSHRLVRRGLTETTAVMLIWLLAALFGGLAVVFGLS